MSGKHSSVAFAGQSTLRSSFSMNHPSQLDSTPRTLFSFASSIVPRMMAGVTKNTITLRVSPIFSMSSCVNHKPAVQADVLWEVALDFLIFMGLCEMEQHFGGHLPLVLVCFYEFH